MKQFTFRLDQALRWRETQLALQKTKIATAVTQRDAARLALQQEEQARLAAAGALIETPDASVLRVWPDFDRRSAARVADLKKRTHLADQAVEAALADLVDANRWVRLFANLKQTSKARWQANADHEQAVFADEMSLNRLQSGKGRARSSAG